MAGLSVWNTPRTVEHCNAVSANELKDIITIPSRWRFGLICRHCGTKTLGNAFGYLRYIKDRLSIMNYLLVFNIDIQYQYAVNKSITEKG